MVARLASWICLRTGPVPDSSLFHDAAALFAGFVLGLDPLVGGFEAGVERGVGFPFEGLFDEGVVAVAAGDAAGGVELVVALKGDTGDVSGAPDELVDGDQLAP